MVWFLHPRNRIRLIFRRETRCLVSRAQEKQKMDTENQEENAEAKTAQENVTPAAEDASTEVVLSELHKPQWSVVTFDTCAARNLTYDEAIQKMAELAAEKMSGLCIVTDNASAQMASEAQ